MSFLVTLKVTVRQDGRSKNEAEGCSVGGIRSKCFVPFGPERFMKRERAKKLAVIDRNLSAGIGGVFAMN